MIHSLLPAAGSGFIYATCQQQQKAGEESATCSSERARCFSLKLVETKAELQEEWILDLYLSGGQKHETNEVYITVAAYHHFNFLSFFLFRVVMAAAFPSMHREGRRGDARPSVHHRRTDTSSVHLTWESLMWEGNQANQRIKESNLRAPGCEAMQQELWVSAGQTHCAGLKLCRQQNLQCLRQLHWVHNDVKWNTRSGSASLVM